MRRRNFLISSVGLGVLSGASLTPVPVGAVQQPEGTVVFEDQTSDRRSIVIAQITIEIDGQLIIRNQDKDETILITDIQAGEYENYEVELNELLREAAVIQVGLHDQEGHGFARDTALVQPDESIQIIEEISPTLIQADSDAGFNYPYYLYAPARTEAEDDRPILVKSNNTGTSSDDLQEHKSAAEDSIHGGFTRGLADNLRAPYLIPVFPRPRTEPVDFTHYVHQLDNDTLAIDGGPLERVDLQLLEMVKHAQGYLSDQGYSVIESGIMLDGFSASGNFVERFSALHPEEVISVTAGGLNGMPLLPQEETVGHTLNYHVGTADIEELTGDPFDLNGFRDVNRFLYMGEFDDSDTIPFPDAWTNDDLRETALEVYGNHMVYDRFAYGHSAYDEYQTNSVFRVYDGWFHTPRPAKSDAVEFHERSINGESGESIREDLGGNIPELGAHVEYGPPDPAPGETITFDGARSRVKGSDITEYAWDFGDGTTANGKTATHTFEKRGGQMVTLTVTDEAGKTHTSVEPIVVRSNPDTDTRSRIEFVERPKASDDVVTLEYTVEQAASNESRLQFKTYGASFKTFDDIAPGQTRRKVVCRFTEQPEPGQTITAAILPPSHSGARLKEAREHAIAITETTVKPSEQTQDVSGFGPMLIEADSEAGFNYPYYLYAPDRSSEEPAKPLLVETNNTPDSTNDFDTHLDFAKKIIDGGFGPALADGLSTAFLVPVFPRPRGDPVSANHNVHQLDDMTMRIEDGPLERVDLQLLSMAEDARQRLTDRGYPVADGLLLNGFSASGNFTERFAALHPEEVVSVTAGGVNGMPILPQEEAVGRSGDIHTLEYHMGVADVEALTGEPFDLESFKDVNRFLYLGEIDVSDTIPYTDSWTREKLRQAALDVYGRDMQKERFQYSRAVYDAVDADAVFRIYEEVGHSSAPAYGDILEFHRRSLAGDPIEDIKADLGRHAPNQRAHIELSPTDPSVGEQIAVHARRTEIRGAEPDQFTWEFGDVTVYNGRYANHTFFTPGTYSITLTVTDSAGNQHRATEYVTVADSENIGIQDPEDLDGDGTFEDINGDGEFNRADVQSLFSDRNTGAVESNVDRYDFNDDGRFSITDIQKLLTMFKQQ